MKEVLLWSVSGASAGVSFVIADRLLDWIFRSDG